jgi:Raf kinase inhibitor-like YbhB/YbcL family protein
MKLSSDTFGQNERIPERCAFGIPCPDEHVKLGENRNPQLSWSDIPKGARSLVLICVDTDVPSSMDDFNQQGRTISASLPRVNFIHWVITDIAATDGSLAEGECSDSITPGGKDTPPGPAGSKQGINDYTGFMAGDEEMGGEYHGYDGPCPPWNDEIPHHYRFKLFALDIDSCGLSGAFTADEVIATIRGHVIDQAELTGVYSLANL